MVLFFFRTPRAPILVEGFALRKSLLWRTGCSGSRRSNPSHNEYNLGVVVGPEGIMGITIYIVCFCVLFCRH
jgi:hypothetical protein